MNVLLTLGTSVGLYKGWHTTRQTNSQTICSTGTRSQHIKHWQRKHYEHYAPLPLHLTENQEWLGSAGNKTKAGWHDHLSFVESGEARPMGTVNVIVHASTFGSSRITFSSRSISGNFVVSKLCWNIFHNNNASQQLLWLLMHRNMFESFICSRILNQIVFLLNDMDVHLRYWQSNEKKVTKKNCWQHRCPASGKSRTIAAALPQTLQSLERHDNTRSCNSGFSTLCLACWHDDGKQLWLLKRTCMKCPLNFCQQIN